MGRPATSPAPPACRQTGLSRQWRSPRHGSAAAGRSSKCSRRSAPGPGAASHSPPQPDHAHRRRETQLHRRRIRAMADRDRLPPATPHLRTDSGRSKAAPRPTRGQ